MVSLVLAILILSAFVNVLLALLDGTLVAYNVRYNFICLTNILCRTSNKFWIPGVSTTPA